MKLRAKTPIGLWIEGKVVAGVLERLQWVEASEITKDIDNFTDLISCWFSKRESKDTYLFDLKGTPFQLKVWDTLKKIPWGETRTYGQIAEQIGSSRAQQAVGQACKRNPLPLLIPCHRVIGQNQSMIGYCGLDHIDVKLALLKWERSN